MRVLVLVDTYPLAPEFSVHHWVPRQIEEMGRVADIDVVIPSKPYPRVKELLGGDWRFVRRWHKTFFSRGWWRTQVRGNLHFIPYFAPPGILGLRRHASRVENACLSYCMKLAAASRYDGIVSLWAFPCGGLAIELGKRLDLPVFVANNEGLEFFQRTKRREAYESLCDVIRRSDVILVQSQWQRDEVVRHIGEKNICLLPLAADVDRRQEDSRSERADIIRLVTVSRLEDPTKNIDLVLRACKRLEESHPGRFSLSVIGDGYARKQLEHFCVSLGLNRMVTFLGHLSNDRVRAELRDHDIFVLPSAYETFGLAFLEAAASGLPVIGYDRVGIIGEMTDFGCAVSIQSQDSDELWRLIVTLGSDSPRRRGMGELGRRLAAEKYTWEMYGGRLRKILEENLPRKQQS